MRAFVSLGSDASMASVLTLTAVQQLPRVGPGDDLVHLVISATANQGLAPEPGDILVVAQKVVSKAEDRLINLSGVSPSPAAVDLAAETDKDPRLVELILSESAAIVRSRPGLIIAEHRCGHVLANAGIDASNIAQRDGEQVLLWPEDPDASATELYQRFTRAYRFEIPVIINDSMGRAWRLGTTGHAIGVAGLDPLWNQVGDRDLYGNELRVTEPATADGLAAAAALVQGEAAEGNPVVWVRGCPRSSGQPRSSRALLRPYSADMFR